jgi:hypothetical protein
MLTECILEIFVIGKNKIDKVEDGNNMKDHLDVFAGKE